VMVTAVTARWLLTAVFAAAGLGSLLVQGRAGPLRAADRVSDVFQVLMCVAMIAITWRSEPALAVWIQGALFGCAVIWFGLASPSGKARLGPASLPGAHHALMAGAMIWMLTAMPADMGMRPAGTGRTAMPAMSHHSMPAMSQPAMAAMSHQSMPVPVLVVSVLLAAYFALAAIPWLLRAIDPKGHVNGTAAASHAAMSAGMAAMLLAML
jgi:hypothetical protein